MTTSKVMMKRSMAGCCEEVVRGEEVKEILKKTLKTALEIEVET